ncbi:DNA primase [Citrobacter phage HCF1]|uniref:DNA primase/helicase n=1 Tax=Citrobacter phage HCF1 TaxID=2849700 RepID=A0ABX6D750_9CAUD|nr:DNA primase [Citrobacter phage HCF1]
MLQSPEIRVRRSICALTGLTHNIFTATGQEVWNCFTPSNLEIVAHRYKGDRKMRVVCRADDKETLIAADERQLDVMIPIDGNFKKVRIRGENYSEAIDTLGEWLNTVPVEIVNKANKVASRDSGYNFGAQASHESCEYVMSKTETMTATFLSVFEAFYPLDGESYQVGVKSRPVRMMSIYTQFRVTLYTPTNWMRKCATFFSLMRKVKVVSHYQKEEVIPRMRGMWATALMKLCNIPQLTFNGKHQPCPYCGGKDRFRWTDKINEKGDGGNICNQCGNDSGSDYSCAYVVKITVKRLTR